MTAPTASAQPLKQAEFAPVAARRKTANSVAAVLIYGAMALAVIPLVWVLGTVILRGFEFVIKPGWWGTSQLGATLASEAGGARHAIIGTLEQVAMTSLISIPIAVFVAIYLVEYGNNSRFARVTTFMVDILSGVPSIVAALFVYALWITTFGFERSGFAVVLALVLLMIPVIVRSTEEMLKIVPQDLREASYALGVPKWRTIASIVLPTSLSGIITGIMLAMARVIGESAPVLILVAAASGVNYNLFQDSQSSLPRHMVDLYKAGAGFSVDKLWATALTLIILIAILNIGARIISAKFSPKKV